MSTLVVIGYNEIHKAEEVRLTLVKLQRDYLIDLEDAVAVTKDAKGKIKLHQTVNLTAAGATSGGFWGMLIGLMFLNPLLGLAVGASAGAVSGALVDLGINDQFMKDLAAAYPEQFGAVRPRQQIHAGQSARGGERHRRHDLKTSLSTKTRAGSRPLSARQKSAPIESRFQRLFPWRFEFLGRCPRL